jgi:hypothetical protein
VSCIQDRDCAGKGDGDKPRCDTHDFSCVECKSASDCALDKPYCVQGKCEASPSDDKQSSPSDDHSGDHAAAGAGFSDDHSGAGTGN